MSGSRYRILASTALALILATSTASAVAQEFGDSSVGPTAVMDQPAAPSETAPGAKYATAATGPAEPAAASEQPAAPARSAPAEDAAATGAPDSVSTIVKDGASTAPAAAPPVPAPAAEHAQPSAPAAAPASPAVAEQPAPPPDPMAAFDPADRAVAEKIRDLFAAQAEKSTDKTADKIFAAKKERSAAEAFYQNRNFAPLWLDKGVENARAKAAIARLQGADADGLDTNDYKTPSFAGLSPDAQAEAELKLTQTVLTYARHVQAGRFPYTRVSHNMELVQNPPDPAEVLAKIADAADAGKALDDFSPPHDAYKKLKALLAELRGKTGASKTIADGPLLKFDAKAPMEDARVPLLREKLGLAGEATDLEYDAELAEAVKKFQHANNLRADGYLGPNTIRELNGPPRDASIDLVIANMERWRWYPRDLGQAHVAVNLPDFTLKVTHNGSQVWTTRIVIGKQDMPTPLLSETMKFITINPTWNVPPSIVYNEYLPALQQDPTVLERMGLKLVYNRDGSVHIYQPPGAANALGRIRFNFPNRFLVYQHDTPDKHMFGHDVRAYSHGCMRVQDPAKYAEVLFNVARPGEGWTAERVTSMFGRGEQDIQLPVPIWVHLTYQTAFVDDAGKLQTRRDIYNIDSRTLAAIRSERGMVEPPHERKREEIASTSRRRVAAPQPPRVFSFFEALFGGGPRYAPGRPVPPRGVAR